MSKQFKTSQNYFIVTDTVTSIEEIRESKDDIVFKNDGGKIHFYYKTPRVHVQAHDPGYTIADVVNGDNGDATFATVAAMLTYLEASTGENQNITVVGFTQRLVTDNVSVVAADDATAFNIATDAKVFTLPLITASMVSNGFTCRFRDVAADDAIALTLAPNALDAFHGTVANAAADSVASGALDKDLVLTKTGSNKGDWIEITAVALTDWYITGGVGVWASQA